MNRRMEIIKEAFERNGFFYTTREVEDQSVLSIGFSVNNGPKLDVNFVFGENKSISIRMYGVVNNVDSQKTGAILTLLNEYNLRFKALKFCLDQDNDVNIEYDLIQSVDENEISAEAVALFVFIVSVAEELFAECMQVILG